MKLKQVWGRNMNLLEKASYMFGAASVFLIWEAMIFRPLIGFTLSFALYLAGIIILYIGLMLHAYSLKNHPLNKHNTTPSRKLCKEEAFQREAFERILQA